MPIRPENRHPVIPDDATVLGTVTRAGTDTGALIQFDKTGLYAQVNCGAIRTLDQRKVVAALNSAEP